MLCAHVQFVNLCFWKWNPVVCGIFHKITAKWIFIALELECCREGKCAHYIRNPLQALGAADVRFLWHPHFPGLHLRSAATKTDRSGHLPSEPLEFGGKRLSSCRHYLSCCCEKIPDQTQLKGGRFYSGLQWGRSVLHRGKGMVAGWHPKSGRESKQEVGTQSSMGSKKETS